MEERQAQRKRAELPWLCNASTKAVSASARLNKIVEHEKRAWERVLNVARNGGFGFWEGNRR